MKYAIQVHPNSDWHSSQKHARKLCDALLNRGADICAVLFYGQATHIASKGKSHDWHDWNTKNCPLLVCSSLHQSLNLQQSDNTPFTVTGMAQWMQLSEQADQLVIIP